MGSKSQVDELEVHIRAIIHDLLELAVTPHVRELRAKAVTYGRVIGNWTLYPPTQAQFDAMTECVTELDQKVGDAQRDANALRESGRMPSSRAAPRIRQAPVSPPREAPPAPRARAQVPPLPRVQGESVPPAQSEFDAFEAALRGDDTDASVVRSRGRVAKGGTKPPARKGPSIIPASHPRPATDTRPTPIPALLQTRRSR